MPATNPGTTGLISWWSLDETSGNRADSHGSNTLTDNNTVLSAAGKQGNAADFERDNTEYLSIVDNAGLSTGDIDFTVGGWVKNESLTNTNTVIAKRDDSDYEYSLGTSNTGPNHQFFFQINAPVTVYEGNAISTGVWYFVVAWHDATNDLIYIQVNNGTAASQATGGSAPSDTTAPFIIGNNNVSATPRPHDGLIDELFFYKRILTADERTWLYNAGAGRAYSELSLPLVTELGVAYDNLLDKLVMHPTYLEVYNDAARPSAGRRGRIIFNPDDGQLNIDDGTNWTLPDGTTT